MAKRLSVGKSRWVAKEFLRLTGVEEGGRYLKKLLNRSLVQGKPSRVNRSPERKADLTRAWSGVACLRIMTCA